MTTAKAAAAYLISWKDATIMKNNSEIIEYPDITLDSFINNSRLT